MPCTNVSNKRCNLQPTLVLSCQRPRLSWLTEMFAFCLSVSHFHKQNGRKMMGAHCTRSSAQVKNAQAFLPVRSAEQPLAAPERVPFFSHSLGKQRMGRGVYCSALISINKIKGGEQPPYQTSFKLQSGRSPV